MDIPSNLEQKSVISSRVFYIFCEWVLVLLSILTSQVNSWNKYKFVTMAKTTMNTIKSDEHVFKMRTKNRDTRGQYRCISKPIASGTIKLNTDAAIWPYGTDKFPRSNMFLPSVNIQSGVIAAIQLKNVICFFFLDHSMSVKQLCKLIY